MVVRILLLYERFTVSVVLWRTVFHGVSPYPRRFLDLVDECLEEYLDECVVSWRTECPREQNFHEIPYLSLSACVLLFLNSRPLSVSIVCGVPC